MARKRQKRCPGNKKAVRIKGHYAKNKPGSRRHWVKAHIICRKRGRK